MGENLGSGTLVQVIDVLGDDIEALQRKCAARAAQRARAECPAFGEVDLTMPMRHRYQAQTKLGSVRQPSSVAIASGE